MSDETSRTSLLELRVGLFVLIGLTIIGIMVVQFGRYGKKLRKSYTLTVELPNASGLLQNSNVLLSGALVGTVTSAPRVLDHARGVAVDLSIYEEIRVPRNAQVVVGSSGLLGDRFVDVITKANDEGGYYAPGQTVHGSRVSGMDDLTRDGGLLVADLRTTVANLNGTITHVNQDLLKDETFKDLQSSLANLREATKNFVEASGKLSGVLDEAKGAVGDARGVIGGAKDTMDSAKHAADDLQGAIGDARKTLGSVRSVTDQAVHGNGLLATLISDKTLSTDLAALVSNLRRSGILFYRDRPATGAAAPELPPPAKRPGNRN